MQDTNVVVNSATTGVEVSCCALAGFALALCYVLAGVGGAWVRAIMEPLTVGPPRVDTGD